MFRIASKFLPQIPAAHIRQISRTFPQHSRKQLGYADIPDEVEEVDVTVKCTKRKPSRHPSMGADFADHGAIAQASGFGDRDACDPKPVCKKFTYQCPQTRPTKPYTQVCIAKKRNFCKMMAALAAFLAALIAGYTYMSMANRDGPTDKCFTADNKECECCTEKEATICCTFVEEPEE